MALSHDVSRAAFIRNSIKDDEYIHVFGEVDIESDDEFRAAIREAADTGRRVVVDLTRCTYIGSQGFAVLVNSRKLANLVVMATPQVSRLMAVVGLSGLLVRPQSYLDSES